MKKLNKIKFFGIFFLIEFLEYRLKLFKIKNLILHLFLLKLRVTFSFTLSFITKNSRVTKIVLEKTFKLSLK